MDLWASMVRNGVEWLGRQEEVMVTGIQWLAVRAGQSGKRSRDRIDGTYYSWCVDLS